MLLGTPPGEIGRSMPDFQLQDANGNIETMSSHLGPGGLVVAFICNHCPYVKAIASSFAEDARDLIAEGCGVLAVMPNDWQLVPADAPEEMDAFAKAHGFTFPYLVDESQSVGLSWGAVCTPEFFGLSSSGTLQYRGRLDNHGMRPDDQPRIRELVMAMRLIGSTGVGPADQMPSMGCSIKWREQPH